MYSTPITSGKGGYLIIAGYNMASKFGIAAVVIMSALMDIVCTQQIDTEVEASLLMTPVTVGGIMAMQCRIRNMREEYSFNIDRFYNGRIEPVTSGNSYLDSSLKSRIFLARRVFPDRTNVIVLTLVDIQYNSNSTGHESSGFCVDLYHARATRAR